MKRFKFRQRFAAGALAAVLMLTPQQSKADLFGGDVVVLTQILANAIQQLMQLRQLLSTGQDSLALMQDINRGLGKAGEAIKKFSWSWSSIGDTFIFIVSYLAFYVLHVTVYFFDAAIAYAWIVLYVFSPLLIALFILPQTASATGALFRSIFEISGWKIVWSVLGTLLWSSAVHNFENVNEHTNFITTLTYTIILSLSVIFTPLVVRALINKGVAGLAGTLSGAAGTAMVASAAGPASLTALATAPAQTLITGAIYSRSCADPFSEVSCRKTRCRPAQTT